MLFDFGAVGNNLTTFAALIHSRALMPPSMSRPQILDFSLNVIKLNMFTYQRKKCIDKPSRWFYKISNLD